MIIAVTIAQNDSIPRLFLYVCITLLLFTGWWQHLTAYGMRGKSLHILHAQSVNVVHFNAYSIRSAVKTGSQQQDIRLHAYRMSHLVLRLYFALTTLYGARVVSKYRD
jgi:hypothetical protein